jgi:hypothetical protein
VCSHYLYTDEARTRGGIEGIAHALLGARKKQQTHIPPSKLKSQHSTTHIIEDRPSPNMIGPAANSETSERSTCRYPRRHMRTTQTSCSWPTHPGSIDVTSTATTSDTFLAFFVASRKPSLTAPIATDHPTTCLQITRCKTSAPKVELEAASLRSV